MYILDEPSIGLHQRDNERLLRTLTHLRDIGNTVLVVEHDEEAIRLMNDSEFGLTAAIFTADAEAAEDIARRLETGTVFMNRADYLDPALCWTGCKNTGRGAGLSELGYLALTRPKSYHFKKA